jgi:hypothetical protein
MLPIMSLLGGLGVIGPEKLRNTSRAILWPRSVASATNYVAGRSRKGGERRAT